MQTTNYFIKYKSNTKDEFNILTFSTNNHFIFKDIEEIRIIHDKNQEINAEYIENIKTRIEKKGFSDLINQKIPIQIKRKGRNIYEEIGKFAAKSIDSKLLQQNKTIQIGLSTCL